MGIFMNLIFCVVVTSAFHNSDNSKVIYNNGDILEMHIVISEIPSKYTGYEIQEYYNGSFYSITNFVNLNDINESTNRKLQAIHPNTILLVQSTDVRQYYIKLQIHNDFGTSPRQIMKVIVEVIPNNGPFIRDKNVRNIINYSLTLEPFDVEYNHQEVMILRESSHEDNVELGQVYEQTCDQDGRFKKEINHSIEKKILWSWKDVALNLAQTRPIRYRFKVQSFDDHSELKCLTNNGRIIPLVNKKLIVKNSQLSHKDPEHQFMDGDDYEFSCQPQDNSSTVNWILLDADNGVKNVSKHYRGLEKFNITLTSNEFDGAKLVCFQYSCSYSKSVRENTPLECTRVVQDVVIFRRFEETKPKSTDKAITNPPTSTEIITVTEFNRPLIFSTSGTTVTNLQETQVQPSSSSIGIIIGVVVAVIILLVFIILLYCKVKKRRKVEDTSTRQDELIYASSEIQYAELELLQKTNTPPPKREEVLYSKVTGVLIPRIN